MANLNNPFISLRHKNFRYYWFGMCISQIGTWMQNIAQPLLAYKLTDSPFLLGLVGALQFLPVLLFSLFAGVIIDRFPKKKLLIITQSASMLITLILAILAFTGEIRYWHLIIMASAIGMANTLDMPARQSFVIELVGKEDLMNAIALNSTVFNISRIIGPAIAGILMEYSGVAFCFFANAISFGAVLISLFFIKPQKLENGEVEKGKTIFQNIGEGLRYILRSEILFSTIIIMAIVGTFAPNFSVLIPVFTSKILHMKEAGFGYLMSFMGVGSLFGAVYVAAFSRSGPKRIILRIVPVAVGLLLILIAFTDKFILTGLVLAITGFFFVMFSSSSNSALQLNTDNEYRGRVMSIYTLVFAGSTPIGNLFAGAMTQFYNARIGFVSCGAAIVVLMIPILILLKGARLFAKQ
ncbi:major facilitator superfamily MFS_1 [Ruminiclostridium papyrosolvens DSM 2782]|uniref:Major facilitator superfamily MFS_1 n=1 Tax=Ruminiclostridium papyrosolvens DSM 2782 TaxID=588581 RepID=F1T7K2_9FIRM|nr:MFS transporter [Ruminiclostridium papyrosolvens]EGD49450.1 major facilitator superfamily MFS_1 [Ruminiclostridium papyrosolvens DSM 2782]WES33424.1 MFS transporter [Ruminiclostridium papyrosolvens DSM 2782]